MNNSRGMVLFTVPIAMVLALIISIPLLFANDCDPTANGNTGPTSDAISIMSWNLCASSCGNWNRRVGPAVKQVADANPDILATQEGGWGAKKRVYTFDGFGSLGYAAANHKLPYIGRYVFYKPSKFTLLASGSFTLGGNHGVAWVKLRTKADRAEFVVADTHLVQGQTAAADADRKAQMATALGRVDKIAAGLPTIWAGDYNSNKSRSTDAPAKAFKAAGYTDARKIAVQRTNADINSAKSRSATAKVKTNGDQTDHVYVPVGVTVSRWNQTVAAENGHCGAVHQRPQLDYGHHRTPGSRRQCRHNDEHTDTKFDVTCFGVA